ncbi:HD domain-containing phosphohydrolase [Ralstonia sp. UNC404CL21Col]|uniref:HD domain-containing phosphohydrolase n=1 Tax=Ralstonia sp. UNC404CL21Col TaxID=1380362 RepID=UPI0004804B2C|nr:HD domain-containing phosphohydrolase [Ralstonia sp. UNC404CL21Col]
MQMRRRYPLHVHLWVLFGALVLVLGALICGIHFLMSKAERERAATEATHRISRETLDEVQDLFAPAQMAVKLVSHSSLADAVSNDERLERLALVRDALDTSPVLQSLYVGYDDGSFFYVRPLRETADRDVFKAPSQAAYVVRTVERAGNVAQGKLTFLDAGLAVVKTVDASDFAERFDPRQRPWYVSAITKGGLIRTEPYMFFSDRQAGATLAVPTASRRAVVGGDVRLDLLGRMLARKETVERGLLALLDANGQVIAIDRSPPASASAPDNILSGLLAAPADYGLPVLTQLAANLRSPGASPTGQALISAGGEAWYTSTDQLTPTGGTPLFLISAVPQDELLKDARRQAWLGIGATGLVILFSLPLIWWSARRIAHPMEALADGMDAIRHFDFQQPIAVRSSISEVSALGETSEHMRQTIQRFLTIVQAVSAEARLEQLLPVLLRKMLNAAGGSAGVLYLANDDALNARVAFDRAGNDVASMIVPAGQDQALPLIRFTAGAMTPRAGVITPDDIRAAGLAPLTADASCHAAAVPLVTREHALQGVILVLRDTPIEPAQLAFVGMLANLCAGALEVRELSEAQRKLFDAFIQVMAGAIDAKSPHTGGHCGRVPELAKMLAHAACDATDGPYKAFQMTEAQWHALHVAAWLHDCGKVTTPEYVIDKATKLETLHDRIHEVRMRFEVLKRDAEIACLHAIAAGEPPDIARHRRDTELAALDDDFRFVATCNLGGEFMDAPQKERLLRIATRTWTRTLDDRLGVSQEELARKARHPAPPLPTAEPLLADKPEHVIERTAHDTIAPANPWGFKLNTPAHLYDRGELHNLMVSRGTLSEEERFKIEDHIVQTQIMLSRMPFPKALRDVPEIAGNHHEKMDGTGYPRRLRREQMSPLARMMAIADVFEALTAADRPYKKAKTLSESVRIMAMARDQQHIDPELFDLFLSSGVYLRYAERFMQPEQIDAVNVAQYVRGAEAASQSAA